MKKIVLLFLSALIFPTSVNAEKKDNLAWDRVTANFYLMGGLMSTCLAHKEGYISDIEKEDLMRFNIKMHRELHPKSGFYISDQVDKFKKSQNKFPRLLSRT